MNAGRLERLAQAPQAGVQERLPTGQTDAAHAQRPLGRLSVSELRAHARAGHFGSGSMGPKVKAACRFVEAGGRRTVITSLDRITGAVAGTAGTVVER